MYCGDLLVLKADPMPNLAFQDRIEYCWQIIQANPPPPVNGVFPNGNCVHTRENTFRADYPGDIQIRYRIKDAPTEYYSEYSNTITLHLVPKIEITTPNPQDDTATFNMDNPGVLIVGAGVEVTPAACTSDLVWNITTMNGSTLEILPSQSPDTVNFKFTTLPAYHAEFAKKKWVYASLPAWNAIDSAQVKVFFPFFKGQNFAYNHSGGVPSEPNWFHYWRQTIAGAVLVQYGYEGPECDLSKRGYYHFREPKFYICESAGMFDGIECAHQRYDGIDLFAVTVRHEAGHYEDYRDMWYLPHGRYVVSLDNDPYPDPPPHHPPDGDLVPDKLEGLGHQYPQFDPLKWNSDYPADDHEDFEDLGYDREYSEWTKAHADTADWANPGHQY